MTTQTLTLAPPPARAKGSPVTEHMAMFGRTLKHMLRDPTMMLSAVGMAGLFLILFTYVFGHSLGAGIGVGASRTDYVNYIMPGIVIFALSGVGSATSLNMQTDVSEGIIDRFRTMPISRASVLVGQFLGSLVQAVLALAVLIGIGLLVGFRPAADFGEWAAFVGLYLLLALAVIWFTIFTGLVSKTPAGANSLSLIVMLVAFLSSAFVPASQMAAWIGWFARYQPISTFIDTFRSLLAGHGVGDHLWLVLAWGIGLTIAFYVLSVWRFARKR